MLHVHSTSPVATTLRPSPPESLLLLRVREMTAAILLPAAFIRLATERFFLTVADGLYPARRQPCLNERILDSIGTTVAESEVVLGRTTLVAMTFQRELDVRVLAQELRIALDRS